MTKDLTSMFEGPATLGRIAEDSATEFKSLKVWQG
jgi:hypothetical protein